MTFCPCLLADFIIMTEALHTLRRLDFPASAKSALQQLESLYGGQSASIPGLGEELSDQIVDEFIFLQTAQGKRNAQPKVPF